MTTTTQKAIYAVVAVLVIAGGVWYVVADRSATPEDGASQDEGAVVATVNGEEVTREELSLYEAQIAAGQGADLASLDDATREQFQDQAIEELIAGVLLRQAADNAGIVATEAEVDTQMDAVRAQFESEEQLQSALSAQGVTEVDLRTQISDSLVVEKYFENELNTNSIVATEEEVEVLYEQQVGVAEGSPPLSEVRDQVEEFVVEQKRQAVLESHIQELRANADVEILI